MPRSWWWIRKAASWSGRVLPRQNYPSSHPGVPRTRPPWPTRRHILRKKFWLPVLPWKVNAKVTVLFADIKDSTELIRDLDPEAAQQLLAPAIQGMMEAVHRFEGTVNQVLSDGIMALFGAPIA